LKWFLVVVLGAGLCHTAGAWEQEPVKVKPAKEQPVPVTQFPLVESLGATMGGGSLMKAGSNEGNFTFGLNLFTLKWDWFYLTAAELRMGLSSGDCKQDGGCGIEGNTLVASRVGIPFYLDDRKLHQIMLGAAVGYGNIEFGFPASQLLVSPSIQYQLCFSRYQRGRARGCAGLEVSAYLPVMGEWRNDYPILLHISVVVSGQADWPGFKRRPCF